MENSIHPAICCIGYNRPESMKRLLYALSLCYYESNNIPLIVSIDQSDRSDEVHKVVEEFDWKYGTKEVRRFSERQGIRKHTLLCGDLSIKYGAIVVFEDDIIPALDFYNYALQALDFYWENNKVFGIGLYSQEINGNSLPITLCTSRNLYDVYWANYDISWGQCWIGSRWSAFREWFVKYENNLPSQNSKLPKSVLNWPETTSWSKYVAYYLAEKELYYITPYISMSSCVSDRGTHTFRRNNRMQVSLAEGYGKKYAFCDYDEGVRIDAFFDRINLPFNNIEGIPIQEICVNLSGAKYDMEGKKYLLSTEKLSYPIISSWAIDYAPYVYNIIYRNYGEGLFLYKIEDDSVYKKKLDYSVEQEYRVLGKYSCKTLIRVLISKLKKRFLKV